MTTGRMGASASRFGRVMLGADTSTTSAPVSRPAAYATPEQLAETTPGLSPDRAYRALTAASDYVDAVCFGVTSGEYFDPVPARVVQATLIAAARFARDPEAPWGTVGGIGEVPIYAKGQVPDADKLLLGLRRSFGLA